MSSDNPPTRKRSRSSRKSASVRTKVIPKPSPSPSPSPTSDNAQLPLESSPLPDPVPTDKPGEPVNPTEKTPNPVEPVRTAHSGIEDPEKGVQAMQDNSPSQESSSTKEKQFASAANPDGNKDQSETAPEVQEENSPDETKKTEKPTGDQSRMPTEPDGTKPTLDKSWEVVMKEVDSLDDGLVKGWKEDIDTLLVFAGLFSAVVTAFTIESYQWLEEQPEDTTVALLKQISWKQINGTTPPDSQPFEVSTSVICINILWFLSLILALVDALFALLCKQWLREHSRHTHTRTPNEALALRWLRKQSLERWHVPTILASLPMLLELALFLFLAGLLELLHTRHPILFGIATGVIVLTALFYIGTTIIPSVNVIRQALQVTPALRDMRTGRDTTYSPVNFVMSLPTLEYTCPLKSPQAWATFQCFQFISHISHPISHMLWFLRWRRYISYDTYILLYDQSTTFVEIVTGLSSWSSVDLELLQRSNFQHVPPFYELSAFRWLVAELRDSPNMIPHLQNILSTIPQHLVMSAVLDQWFFLPDREWADGDIEAALRLGPNNHGIQGHISSVKQESLDYFRATDKFNRLLHWVHVSIDYDSDFPNHIQPPLRPQILLASFSSIDQALNQPEQHRSRLLSCLWELYKQMVEDPAVRPSYLAGLMEDLAPHIIACSPDYALEVPTATTTSPFVESDTGYELLHKIHDDILKTKAYDRTDSFDVHQNWMEATDIVRRVYRLPEGHFKPLPGIFPLRLSKLKESLSRLSPTSPATDFGYLDSFRINWGNAYRSEKRSLVEILSEHINNYPQSTTNSNTRANNSMVSPLVLSSPGLELITVVNNQLAENWDMYESLWEEDRIAWHKAMKQVKTAQPDLPPDHFKDISHRVLSIPSTNVDPSIQEDVPQVGTQPQDSPSGRGVSGGEENHGKRITCRSSNSVSLLDAMGEEGVQPAVKDVAVDSEGEDIPMQPLAAGGPEQSNAESGSEVKKMGGPGADEKV
ncbi:hypothetical protein PQX77_016062 [Marasmius sp. AFHP31]|nr:hypothetical protein PQX77_016062 [Marasmius sp. AFHP31]